MKGDMDALMELVFDDDEFYKRERLGGQLHKRTCVGDSTVVPTGPAGGEEEVDGRVVPGGGEAGS